MNLDLLLTDVLSTISRLKDLILGVESLLSSPSQEEQEREEGGEGEEERNSSFTKQRVFSGSPKKVTFSPLTGIARTSRRFSRRNKMTTTSASTSSSFDFYYE